MRRLATANTSRVVNPVKFSCCVVWSPCKIWLLCTLPCTRSQKCGGTGAPLTLERDRPRRYIATRPSPHVLPYRIWSVYRSSRMGLNVGIPKKIWGRWGPYIGIIGVADATETRFSPHVLPCRIWSIYIKLYARMIHVITFGSVGTQPLGMGTWLTPRNMPLPVQVKLPDFGRTYGRRYV